MGRSARSPMREKRSFSGQNSLAKVNGPLRHYLCACDLIVPRILFHNRWGPTMTDKERQASNNTLDIPPPAQSVPHVSKPAAVMTLVSGIWAFFWFLGAGVIGKIVLLIIVIALFKLRGPWLKGAFQTLRRSAPDLEKPRETSAPVDGKEAELHRMANERMDELTPDMKVRGVWENIETRNSNWKGVVFKHSQLHGVELGLVNGLFVTRSEKKPTWSQAIGEPLGQDREVLAWIDLDSVASVEIDNAARYAGESTNPFGYDVPSYWRDKIFNDRHPFASRNKLGGGYMDYSSVWIVFIFQKDGTRRPIFRTFDYDLALRLRTRANNLFDQWRMEGTAQKAVPADSADDYL